MNDLDFAKFSDRDLIALLPVDSLALSLPNISLPSQHQFTKETLSCRQHKLIEAESDVNLYYRMTCLIGQCPCLDHSIKTRKFPGIAFSACFSLLDSYSSYQLTFETLDKNCVRNAVVIVALSKKSKLVRLLQSNPTFSMGIPCWVIILLNQSIVFHLIYIFAWHNFRAVVDRNMTANFHQIRIKDTYVCKHFSLSTVDSDLLIWFV